MKTHLLKFTFLVIFGLSSLMALSQGTLRGTVVDAETNETLIGASVVIDGTTTGTVTNFEGKFSLDIDPGNHNLNISFIGYVDKKINVAVTNGHTNDLGTINLRPESVGINEVMVLASVAVQRKTPVALSTIQPIDIAEKLGTQEYPEILKSTPGIYATRQGGGFGDSRVNVRGFDMKNTAVMINGIPVNDMENGWVYWSNWAGLSEVTRTMQVQRGLGASKLSIGSVGGTINILTKTTDAEKGGSVYTGIGNDGYLKTSFTVSTGVSDNDWALTLSGARTTGEGWVDATQFESWSYFASLSKRWSNQMLSFTMFGAPQTHGQRSSKQSIETYKDPAHDLRYNREWGYKNGQVFNLRQNFYHKPQASLNHYLTLSEKTTLSTSAYVSFGTGGGTGEYGPEGSKFFTEYRENQINFDKIVDENIANGNGGSTAIIRASRNDHNWYGLLSNLQHDLNENFSFSGGIDLRYYKGEHFREVIDLMGGDFVLSTEDENDPNKIARVGDKIGYYNDGLVSWQGLFGQVEYSKDALSTFLAASVSNTGYKRIDYFNYLDSDPAQESEWVNHMGFVVKGGANYNLDEKHNVFGNIGYFERAPFFDAVFINFVNQINEGANNEKTMAFEFGYGYKSSRFSANVNAYYTNWKDKFFRRTMFAPDGSSYSANIAGVNALHMGIEGDFVWKPTHNLDIKGMISLGDWRWQNDLDNVPIYNDNQELLGTVDLYIADLKVGDAAQTTMSLGLDYEIMDGLKVGLDYYYYDNLYASYDPTGRGDAAKKGVQPWKMPAYGLFDANLSYYFKIGDFDASLYTNVFNLMDTEYVSDADDGSDNDWQTAKVFYGIGRTWSTGLRVNF
jgi:hypothetical protein